jgi:hypothetical protein
MRLDVCYNLCSKLRSKAPSRAPSPAPCPFEGTAARRACVLAASARDHPVPRLVFGATAARFGNISGVPKEPPKFRVRVLSIVGVWGRRNCLRGACIEADQTLFGRCERGPGVAEGDRAIATRARTSFPSRPAPAEHGGHGYGGRTARCAAAWRNGGGGAAARLPRAREPRPLPRPGSPPARPRGGGGALGGAPTSFRSVDGSGR